MSALPTERFEQILEKLQCIVEKLEGGRLSLEESLRAFEEGVRLSRSGAKLLDEAERKVEALLVNADGSDKIVPLPEGSEEVPF
jgi:exodeoxyribonuclease VII small subunit